MLLLDGFEQVAQLSLANLGKTPDLKKQDGELVTWKGSGQGKFKDKGAVSYRGILYYRTTSQKLARLNSAPCVFEYEIDPEGKTTAKFWEWK